MGALGVSCPYVRNGLGGGQVVYGPKIGEATCVKVQKVASLRRERGWSRLNDIAIRAVNFPTLPTRADYSAPTV
jgi:hypothetical protein